jgi:dATP pyrophosphohydrolase
MSTRTTQVEVIIFKIINNEILFLLLKRNPQKGNFWQPVTGGVENEENLIQAVNRELYEETSITQYLRIIDDVYYFEFNTDECGILKEYVFGVEVTSNTEVKISYEHTEYKWCRLEEALDLIKYDSNKIAMEKLYLILSATKGDLKII